MVGKIYEEAKTLCKDIGYPVLIKGCRQAVEEKE